MKRFRALCLLCLMLFFSFSTISGQDPTCPDTITPMLTIGQTAQVTPDPPNTVRAEPKTDAEVLGQIPGGGVINVLEGPICGDNGIVWWQVDYNGLVGWTGEGQHDQRWIEPIRDLTSELAYWGISADPTSPPTLYHFDTETGQSTLLVEDSSFRVGLSPDGQLLAYEFENVIYVIDLQGNLLRSIPITGEFAANEPLSWSPDAQQIAFVTGQTTIQVVNIDGTGQAELVTCERYCRDLRWANDGSGIYYLDFQEEGEVITFVSIETGELTQFAVDFNGNIHKMAVSPTEMYIAFLGDEDSELNVYYLNLATGDTTQATSDIRVEDLAWSLDGRYLAYTTQITGPNQVGKLIIQDPTNLQGNVLFEWEPEIEFQSTVMNHITWSPDNFQIAFSVHEAHDGTFEDLGAGAAIPTLYIIEMDGTDMRKFTAYPDTLFWLPMEN